MYKFLTIILALLMSITSFADFNNRNQHGGRGGGRGGEHRGGDRGRNGHREGHISRPVHFHPGPEPRGGWRGPIYFYGGYNYYLWSWGPYSPWYGWPYYYGWHVGLWYYVPSGMKCYADNSQVSGTWAGKEVYYSSDDAINSALGWCENDRRVVDARAEDLCRIRNCTEWY